MPAPKVRQFAGDFRMWEKAPNGALTPVIPDALDPSGNQPIETESMSFGYEAGDEVTINSKRRGARYGQPIFVDTQPGSTSITMQLLEMPTPILARVLFGEAANQDITAGAVTDEDFIVTQKGAPMALPHRYINTATAPVVKSADGVTTYVAGTDYVVDGRQGTLLVKDASAITVGASLQLSYSFESVTGTRIVGGSMPTKSFVIHGDMEDRISGENGRLEVFEARMTIDGDVDWLSAEPIQPTLTGKLVVPAGAPGPYTFDVYEQAA